MTQNEFQKQMARLFNQFGEKAFGTERTRLIWEEVKNLSSEWFEKVISKFIGEMERPPLLPAFRDEVSLERERIWRTQKRDNEKDAKDFFQTMFADEDVKTICEYIVKRLAGSVANPEFETFLKHLHHAATSVNQKIPSIACNLCNGSGLVFQKYELDYEYVFRCTCAEGKKRTETYPFLTDNDKEASYGV